MKNMLKLLAIASLVLGATAAQAKDTTLSGEGKCAKCALHKTDSCQNVLEVKDGDKTTLYYLVGDVSKKAHKELGLCGGTAKLKVTGTVAKKEDRMELTASKIDKAE